jgi:hypothetical protein
MHEALHLRDSMQGAGYKAAAAPWESESMAAVHPKILGLFIFSDSLLILVLNEPS